MSCSCTTMTDEQLLAEIKEYQAALKSRAMGGGVAVVAGEGRRVEYVGSDIALLQTALRDLITEAKSRGLICDNGSGGAIAVEIG